MGGKAAEEAPFDSQIGVVALIAEINLLLDFISGRSDRTLVGSQQMRMPAPYTDYGQMLDKFFDIRSRVTQHSSEIVKVAATKTPVDEMPEQSKPEDHPATGADEEPHE